MGRILVHEFISLDGVNEDPAWTRDYPFDPKMAETIGEMMGPGTAILLGRRTYEMFYPAWSKRSAEDDPGAPFFNDSQKYVVSGTLQSADWDNTTIVGAYSAEAIRSLKESADRDLYVSGSTTLVRAMLADGLVDELHLFVYPVALGQGERLFPQSDQPLTLALAGSDAYDSGVVHLGYRPA